ncbi:uroporphyrinogen-III synthase, partial [Noviluteimonas dokdonensis]|uniref:uroporphyrinogen-III synthase n=1 Tax=Noviluteimonas dokdonensis TaxID=414050 RepID=UPI0005692751
MREKASQRTPAWYVISLRPLGQHDAVRRAAMRAGMGCVALSTMRIVARGDTAARRALRDALAAPRVVFTSPNAVRAAAAMAPLRRRRAQHVFAIGAGTAAALRRAGITDVQVPPRADSDALLAMEALRDVA